VQLVACVFMVQLTCVPFSSRLFFNHHVCHGCGGRKILFVLSLCIYLFSFFLYSHSKTTEVQIVSQCVMAKIKLLLL
jgi:hypothetical protein